MLAAHHQLRVVDQVDGEDQRAEGAVDDDGDLEKEGIIRTQYKSRGSRAILALDKMRGRGSKFWPFPTFARNFKAGD